MRAAASVELVVQLAGQGATSSRFGEIQPEHILAAVLKFSELPVEEVDRMAPGSDAAKQLAGEVHAIRQELASRSIDSKQARRRLRAELGRGDAVHVRPPLHRSQASREVFDTAARLAENSGCEALKAQHLLEAVLLSPTPVIMKVFGDALRTKTWKPGETPMLDRFGRDLTRLAAEGKLPAAAGRGAEQKALLRALIEANKPAVLLVTDNIDVAREVVGAVAQAIAKGGVPATLKGKRIVDISTLDPDMGKNTKLQPQLEEAFAEAARAENLLLLTPAIEPHVATLEGDWWHDMLRTALEQGDIRMICPVTTTGYMWVEKNRVWRRWAHAMWLHEGIESELPPEW